MSNFEEIVKKHVDEDGNIPASAIGTVISAIKTAVGNEYVEKERYKAKLTEIDTLKEKAQTAEDNVTTAEKWKTKYDALKEEFSTYKKTEEAKATRASKEEAYKGLLKNCGIADKRIAAVLKVSDVDNIELDKDGNIKDAKELEKSIKEEWSDFITTDGATGAKTSNPPTNNGGKKTKEEILAIKDTAERQAAMAENPEVFGL